MSDFLFDIPLDLDPEMAVRHSAREPEVCPVCGLMAEYVERFSCGRYMASHGSVDGRVRGIVVKVARVCHGFSRIR